MYQVTRIQKYTARKSYKIIIIIINKNINNV